MVLLFRLIWTLFTSRFRPRIDPLGEAVIRMRVWPNDLDLNIHVSSGRYLSFMDVGRVDLLIRFRVFRKAFRRGWRPINAGTIISFRKSLLPFERFSVRSRVICWDEKWIFFEHIVDKANGDRAAIANSRGLLRGSSGNVRPQEFLEAAGHGDLQSPPMPPHVARWIEAEAAR